MPAATSVWDFSDGEILSASKLDDVNCGVHVFTNSTTRSAAYGGTGERTLAAGEMSYLLDTGKIEVYNGTSWISISSVRNVAAFTSSGTWTVPTGVTYAVANIRGGGGGVGDSGSGNGGTSSVAFAAGTVSATGGGLSNANLPYSAVVSGTRAANSGQGAFRSVFRGADVSNSAVHNGGDGAFIVAGGVVTPAASITVTVGAGGTAGTNGAAGGSGYVWIEYEV
jgi:hypothetical protein